VNTTDHIAPPWQVSQWLNSPQPVTLASLRGQVVVLHAFQMLCPGCVSHGVPQALRIRRLFPQGRVAVIGLHTVFEHHDVMGPPALRVFLDEYRVSFPVGVDHASDSSPVPLTMQAYGLRGTPSIVIFDQSGGVRLSHFGQIDDLQLGAVIGQLLAQAAPQPPVDAAPTANGNVSAASCADGGCAPDLQSLGRAPRGAS
jgi:hypothetical protein